MTGPDHSSLKRILGFGFAIAVAFGGTIGVGILRLPGEVAAHVGSVPLLALVWLAGGAYATLGAMSVAELVTMMPAAGGFYVYARRAFGPRFALLVGFNDWAVQSLAIAYAAFAAADFLGELVPALAGHGQAVALAVVGLGTLVHSFGLRVGSRTQNAISVLVALSLIGLMLACFAVTPPAAAVVAAPPPRSGIALAAALLAALRLVLVAYDGWYSSIYFAEETVDAVRSVPRAMIGSAILTTALYLLINAGLLHALTLSGLAAAKLPVVEAARVLLPGGAATLVAAISLCVVLSLLNATLLMAPRILYALGRDGLLPRRTAWVSRGGTPAVALAATSAAAALAVGSGTFEQIIDASALLFVLNYLTAYLALMRLRRREPAAERPFRVPGYPWTTTVVLLGSLAYVVLAVLDDPRTGLAAGLTLAAVGAVSWWVAGRRSGDGATASPG
ncbi:MAG: APC family permease [Proteobacteria bacterium]|nr:APC family permease [Pseudomonadota bacterium]